MTHFQPIVTSFKLEKFYLEVNRLKKSKKKKLRDTRQEVMNDRAAAYLG